jgi:hypothetical protein
MENKKQEIKDANDYAKKLSSSPEAVRKRLYRERKKQQVERKKQEKIIVEQTQGSIIKEILLSTIVAILKTKDLTELQNIMHGIIKV